MLSVSLFLLCFFHNAKQLLGLGVAKATLSVMVQGPVGRQGKEPSGTQMRAKVGLDSCAVLHGMDACCKQTNALASDTVSHLSGSLS